MAELRSLQVPNPIISCVIPCRDPETDPYLPDLISSIKAQDFPQDKIEILVISEGDSEQAKGIGIKRAKGEIIGMFCADNEITSRFLFSNVYQTINCGAVATYPARYDYKKSDNSLNRYFSLIGGNDPICYYLGKNDRVTWVDSLNIYSDYQPSYGCNGFFYKTEAIKATNLDNYYPMDNALEVKGKFVVLDCAWIWHKTSDNLITFLMKRYRYARDLYSDRDDRRWKMLDTKEDYWKLCLFALSTITVVQPLLVSLQGFRRFRDWAWFWHWPVCFGFLITYSILAFRNLFKHGNLFQVRCQPAV